MTSAVVLACALVVLAACRPVGAAATPDDGGASDRAAPLPGGLRAAFTRPAYHLGDDLVLEVTLTNGDRQPWRGDVVVEIRGGALGSALAAAPRTVQTVLASAERLDVGGQASLTRTYAVPADAYRAVGTGEYRAVVEAGGLRAVAATDLVGVLALELSGPRSARLGDRVTITATVTNPSAEPIADARLYGFGVPLAERRLASLRPGQAVALSWSFALSPENGFDLAREYAFDVVAETPAHGETRQSWRMDVR